jgi:hypothetical protein
VPQAVRAEVRAEAAAAREVERAARAARRAEALAAREEEATGRAADRAEARRYHAAAAEERATARAAASAAGGDAPAGGGGSPGEPLYDIDGGKARTVIDALLPQLRAAVGAVDRVRPAQAQARRLPCRAAGLGT